MVETRAETPPCFLELILTMSTRIVWSVEVLMQAHPFLSELTNMYERSTEKGSVWVTMKRSSMKCKARLKKMADKGETVEYRCLVRASDGKRNISTSLGSCTWNSLPPDN